MGGLVSSLVLWVFLLGVVYGASCEKELVELMRLFHYVRPGILSTMQIYNFDQN